MRRCNRSILTQAVSGPAHAASAAENSHLKIETLIHDRPAQVPKACPRSTNPCRVRRDGPAYGLRTGRLQRTESWGRAFGRGSKWRFWLFEGAIQDSRSIRINHPTASAVTVRVRRQRQSCERTVIHSLSQLAQNVFLCFIISSSGICWSVALGASPPPPRPPPSSSPCIDPSGLAYGPCPASVSLRPSSVAG